MKKTAFSLLCFLLLNLVHAQYQDEALVEIPYDLATHGDDLYILSRSTDIFNIGHNIYKKDLNDPSTNVQLVYGPVLTPNQAPILNKNIQHMVIDNDYLYFLISERISSNHIRETIYKLNLLNQNATPEEVYVFDNLSINPYTYEFDVKDNYLYIPVYDSNPNPDILSIKKIDLTITNPSLINVINLTTYVRPTQFIIINNDIFFFTSTSTVAPNHYPYQIGKINITSQNLVLTDLIDNNDYHYFAALTYSNNHIYYFNLNDGHTSGELYKIDVSDPNYPVTPSIGLLGFAWGLTLVGDDLYYSLRDADKVIKVNINDPNLSVNEFTSEEIILYPNPTSNFIQISNLKSSKAYKIYNVLGVEVLNGAISNTKKIDISTIENGVYFLELENTSIKKFIKK